MNRKNVIVYIVVLGGLALGVETSGTKHCDSASSEIPTGWVEVDASDFRIALPPGWEYQQLQGEDSHVGDITNGELSLFFDYGWHSNPLKHWREPEFSRRCLIIDGFDATIVNAESTERGALGIHFGDLGGHNGLTITGHKMDPTQRELVATAFEHIDFN